jgi:hypothetical protein
MKRPSCYSLHCVVECLQTYKHFITNLYATGTGRGEPPRKLLLRDDELRLGIGDVWYFVCIIYKVQPYKKDTILTENQLLGNKLIKHHPNMYQYLIYTPLCFGHI